MEKALILNTLRNKPVTIQPNKIGKRTTRRFTVLINQQRRSVSVINLKCNKPKSRQRKDKECFPTRSEIILLI